MIALSELTYVFVLGAVVIVALCLYNKFGKAKQQ